MPSGKIPALRRPGSRQKWLRQRVSLILLFWFGFSPWEHDWFFLLGLRNILTLRSAFPKAMKCAIFGTPGGFYIYAASEGHPQGDGPPQLRWTGVQDVPWPGRRRAIRHRGAGPSAFGSPGMLIRAQASGSRSLATPDHHHELWQSGGA